MVSRIVLNIFVNYLSESLISLLFYLLENNYRVHN